MSIGSVTQADPLGHPALETLVVDDHERNRNLLRALLAQLGCQVSLAATGAAAVRLACRKPYHLIIMDWRMPGLNGDQAASRIRRQGASQGAYLARWSTDPPLPDCAELYDAQLPKPVTCAALALLVSRARHQAS